MACVCPKIKGEDEKHKGKETEKESESKKQRGCHWADRMKNKMNINKNDEINGKRGKDLRLV